MAPDPFDRDHAPEVGVAERIRPGLRVVTAPNAGPMTFTGTRSYILGAGRVAVIDPGPRDPAHVAALVAALDPGEAVAAILVTHAHRDHSGGAAMLGARADAPVLAFGASGGGGASAALGGGEGMDAGFRPDRRLDEGAVVAGPGWRLRALHTPGHAADHLCFGWEQGRALFSGDTVMGWATTLISPPDGRLGAFLASLRRLEARVQAGTETTYYPGHGAPVGDPARIIAHQLAHREARTAQILAALTAGPARPDALVARIYIGLDPALRPAAARNVLAHLIDLMDRGAVRAEGPLSAQARFALI